MSGPAPVLFALLALAAASAPAAAGPLAATRVTLRNGLRVVLAPDSLATAVDVAVWYPAGARWEPSGHAGVTRLVERLMFRGSAHVADGELRRRLTAAGGTVNTSATPDYSCFWETIPAPALGEALRDEADRMASLTAAPAALEEERRAMRADRAAR
ncbi:MAG TPA: insulinase family protein, partial [Candidatus Eisenbacteria bacterium]|nr:insulinase family protein [Candidatus Eisenbacteria bacterium]